MSDPFRPRTREYRPDGGPARTNQATLTETLAAPAARRGALLPAVPPPTRAAPAADTVVPDEALVLPPAIDSGSRATERAKRRLLPANTPPPKLSAYERVMRRIARRIPLLASPFARAGVLLFLGILALLGTYSYGYQLPRPYNYLHFWVALGICLLGTLLYGLNDQARTRHHLTALAAFGAITWLPHFLRSPYQSLFSDELFHFQILQQIVETGHNRLPITFYPIPGEFPGLHFSALALAGATGLPLEWSARLLTLVIHAAIPTLAYVTARGFGLLRRGAFIAALIYIANTSYYFFHAVFSYETLGVFFVLAVWSLLSRRNASLTRRDLWLAVPLLAGLAVTHHISSYILALTLVMAWAARGLAQRFGPAEARATLSEGISTGICTLLAIGLPIAWAAIGTVRTVPYLANSFAARLGSIASSIAKMFGERSESRALFQGSPLPLAERLLDFAYVPLLLLLALGGVGLIAWRLRLRHAPAIALALAPCGPLAWFVTVPAVLTPASELAYRSWPFLFLGVALFASIALTMLASVIGSSSRRWLAPAGWPLAALILAVLLFGGISIGDDQAGRFPQATPTKAAGPEVITPDLTSAARWIEATYGRYSQIVGDGTTQMIFATLGFQKATGWGEWTPFLAATPGEVSQYMAETQTRFLVADRRITTLPPRYGYYFSDAEIYLPEAQQGGREPGDPLPAAWLDKFDRVPDLARTYDNGNIQIFERRVPVTLPGVRPND